MPAHSVARAARSGAAAGCSDLCAGPFQTVYLGVRNMRDRALSRIQVRPQIVAAAVSPALCRSQFGRALRREQSPPNACCTVSIVSIGRRLQHLSLCPLVTQHPSNRTRYPALSLLHQRATSQGARLLSPNNSLRANHCTRPTSPLSNWCAQALRTQQTSRPPQPCARLCFLQFALVDAAIAGS